MKLILSDIIMPKMGGFALFRALKNINPCVKAVLMTAYPVGEEKDKFFSEGILNWIQKPINLNKLSQIIKNALEKNT